MEPNPKFLRLKTGEDLICECVELSDTRDNVRSLQVINPLKVMYVPGNKPGTMHIGLCPWLALSITEDQQFIIREEDVLITVNVSEEMCSHYWASIETFAKEKEEAAQEETEEEPEEVREALEEILSKDRTWH